MQFRLDITPVGKGRPRLGKNHVFTPSKTKVFEETIKTLTAHLTPFEGALKIEFTFVFPRPKSMSKRNPGRQPKTTRPDTDNLIKSISDALNGRLYTDDAQLIDVRGRKFYAAIGEDPHIQVECLPYQDEGGVNRAREAADRWDDHGGKIEVILAALEQGANLTEAASQAKISTVTLGRWRKKIEGLDDAIHEAKERAEIHLLNALKSCGEAKEDWRAFAWLLERQYPDRWGQPKNRVDVHHTTLRQEQQRRAHEIFASFIDQTQSYVQDDQDGDADSPRYDTLTRIQAIYDEDDAPF